MFGKAALGAWPRSCNIAAMWRRLVGLEEQTIAEKRAMVDGTNLFFGALIGANLGSLDVLPIGDYLLIIITISLIVLYIHLAPVARRRWSVFAHLAFAVAGLWLLLISPVGAGLFDADRPPPHLFATICFWLVSVAWVELRPVRAPADPG
jgi:hypothetical protein